MDVNRIIWLTGKSGAGKTTLAKLLQQKLGGVVLDGDEMRESISLGAGFSKQDREAHNLRVARLAVVLARQVPVIVAVITPFEDTRKKVDDLCKPLWVYVKRELPEKPDQPYEEPQKKHITLNSDTHTAEQNAQIIYEFVK